jgi:hypothetical protein
MFYGALSELPADMLTYYGDFEEKNQRQMFLPNNITVNSVSELR